MAGEKHKITPAAYLFLIKDNKIFLCRRQNTGFKDGQYSLISGHFEKGESPRMAMKREAKEEAGLEIEINDLKLVHIMSRGLKVSENERVDFFFELKNWKGELRNTEPDKCDDMRWFPINNLPKNTVDYVRHFIECYKKEKFYSEFGW